MLEKGDNLDESLNESDLLLANISISQFCSNTPRKRNASFESLSHKHPRILQEKNVDSSFVDANTSVNLSVVSIPTESQAAFLNQCEQDECTFYGLPRRVREVYKERGIKQLYFWQDQCLSIPEVTQGRNLIYSLPTSGGKTLVAELLMLKTLLVQKLNALFILPFVSIVVEKVQALTSLGLNFDFFVEEYASNKGRIPPAKRPVHSTVYVATIEKAHVIINSLIDEKRTKELGILVVDEVHMIGEGGPRGACLEMILAKVRFLFRELLAVGIHRVYSAHVRIVSMSATLTNLPELAEFMDAHLYTSDFRPVDLQEYVKYNDSVFKVDRRQGKTRSLPQAYLADCLSFDRRLGPGVSPLFRSVYASSWQLPQELLKADPDHIVPLTLETLEQRRTVGRTDKTEAASCLIFCPTKSHCESTARMLAELLPGRVSGADRKEVVDQRELLLQNLRMDNQAAEPDGKSAVCCPVLNFTIPRGIAYHHGGLTLEERKAIEEAYSDGVLRVLCCTSTLAAGVNLPARRSVNFLAQQH